MRPISAAAAIALALTASAHAVEPRPGIVFDPEIWQIILSPDASHALPFEYADVPTAGLGDVAAVEAVPLPRPKPSIPQIAIDSFAMQISAYRHLNGQGGVATSPELTRVAQEQANAMAARDTLDHSVLGSFSSRIGRTRFSRAAENIAYGHDDFPRTLKQWINSSGHRSNLLMQGAKWVGVAHARNGRRTYWAMVIGTDPAAERAAERAVDRGRSSTFRW
jgi:hypothetical protein